MKYEASDHTFAVCAYKESPYLRECIESLLAQTVKSNIIITTSTDNEFIRGIAQEYQLPLIVNPGEGGIANDWNFGYHQTTTKLMTIAHQDDRYHPEYVEDMLEQLNKAKNPIIYFTGYNELRNGKIVEKSTMLTVKRLMLKPLQIRAFHGCRFIKRLCISMGNPVSCWSVCYVKDKLPETVFVSDFKSNLDWEEWEKLSREKGDFVYWKRPLTYHRVHEGSETSNAINNGNIRGQEDYAMFLKFWPTWLAKFIMKFYIKGEKLNEVD